MPVVILRNCLTSRLRTRCTNSTARSDSDDCQANARSGDRRVARSSTSRKSHSLSLIYIVDVEVANETVLLKKFSGDLHLKPTPDMEYHFVGPSPPDVDENLFHIFQSLPSEQWNNTAWK